MTYKQGCQVSKNKLDSLETKETTQEKNLPIIGQCSVQLFFVNQLCI